MRKKKRKKSTENSNIKANINNHFTSDKIQATHNERVREKNATENTVFDLYRAREKTHSKSLVEFHID